jgi:hypothetical protein
MGDQQDKDKNRQGDEQRAGGGHTASKGINPVQHSERGINPVQHSEGKQGGDDEPGRGDVREQSSERNKKGDG